MEQNWQNLKTHANDKRSTCLIGTVKFPQHPSSFTLALDHQAVLVAMPWLPQLHRLQVAVCYQ